MTRAALTLLTICASAQATGLLDDGRQLHGPEHVEVEVSISSQVATTVVAYDFAVDGGDFRFLFPTPENASVVGFAVHDGSDWVEAGLTRDGASPTTSVPNSPVQQPLDEHLGGNALKVEVSAAGGGLRVQVTYIEILPYDFGEVRYSHPLKRFAGARSPGSYRLELDLRTGRAIRGALSDGFGSEESVVSSSALRRTLRYHGALGDRDFRFDYSVEQEGLYTHLLTHHDDCDASGYFLLIVEPPHEVSEADVLPKYFTFVVDTSGSMAGEKLEQVQEAATFFVGNLNPDDRFNVVRFANTAQTVFDAPQDVNASSQRQARRFINELWANGGTNIDGGLREALGARAAEGFARILILLTDGVPTAGEQRPEHIVGNARRANTADARLFTFGVGSDVDATLLRALAAENRGTSQILDAEGLGKQLSDFFLRINRPVLTDARLDVGEADLHDYTPDVNTDLFAGSQLFVVGRYTEGVRTTGTLEGSIRGGRETYEFELDFARCARGDNAFLPRLWAKARIEALLDRIAREGGSPALVAEVEKLSLQYGVQTPYTRYDTAEAPTAPPPATRTPQSSGSSPSPRRSSPRSFFGGAHEEEHSGCSTSGDAPTSWLLMLPALFGLRRRAQGCNRRR